MSTASNRVHRPTDPIRVALATMFAPVVSIPCFYVWDSMVLDLRMGRMGMFMVAIATYVWLLIPFSPIVFFVSRSRPVGILLSAGIGAFAGVLVAAPMLLVMLAAMQHGSPNLAALILYFMAFGATMGAPIGLVFSLISGPIVPSVSYNAARSNGNTE